jgi:citronellol/citronellal dehydrogenase
MKLKDRIAIVTGASRGIGKAIAIDFAKEGAVVVVAARTEKEQEKLPGTIYATAQEINALGGRAVPLKCNVGDEQSVQEMVDHTLKQFGTIDILVNNAALGYYVPFQEIPLRHMDLLFRINVRGPFICTQAVLPKMVEMKRGSIVNITSSAAEDVFSRVTRKDEERRPVGLLYGCTKAALNRFTRGLAVEVAKHNVAINAVAPTFPTYSEGLVMWNPQVDKSLFRSPHQYMTKAVIFLAAQDSQGVTGGVFYDEELCWQHNL